jgi:hypothetical protein
MAQRLSIFWLLYMLFFAIPFPMLLYYNIKSENMPNLSESNPWISLGLVVLSILLWIILLTGYFRKWVLRNFSIKRNIEHLKTGGVSREAKILEATKISKPNAPHDIYELVLGFKNLAGSGIVQKTMISDAKPYERRFEVGKKVGLLIDKDIKQTPCFMIANAEVIIKKTTVALIAFGWLALLCLVIAYYGYSYQSENDGMGWRFMSLFHPLIICPAVLLFYRLIARLIFSKLAGKPKDAVLIKFKGIETTANLIKASETGTYINDRPMISFELEFLDKLNQKHKVNIKKLVSLLDLDITKQQHVSIFYLEEDPQQAAFAKDLNEIKGEF